MRARLLLGATLAVAVAFLVACSDGDGGDRPAPTDGGPSIDALGLPVAPEAPPVTPENGASGGVVLRWWGQSTFELSSPRGADILIDPYSDGIGYRVPELSVAFITVSHEHLDHNNTGLAGDATILRGLTGSGWAQIDERPTVDVRIRSLASWHDDAQGDDRGRNAIFVFETGGLRIVHLGDLGHALTPEQIAAIGPVDVLLVPVGGFFTIDAKGAQEVVVQLAPRVVIPMHYKTQDVTINQLRPVQPFLAGQKFEEKGTPTVTLSAAELPPPGSAAIWVLEPAGAQ